MTIKPTPYVYDESFKYYGVTTDKKTELFIGKCVNDLMYGFSFMADKNCIVKATDVRDTISTWNLKSGQQIQVSKHRPFKSLELDSEIGTNFDVCFDC